MTKASIIFILVCLGTLVEIYGWFYLGHVLEILTKWYCIPFLITGFSFTFVSIIACTLAGFYLEDNS